MYEVYDKLTTTQQKKLLREIDKEYSKTLKELKAEVDLIIADKGKSQRDKIKALGAIIGALWVLNSTKIINVSEIISKTTFAFYEYASIQLGNPLIIPQKEVSLSIGKMVKRRKDLIKWNRLINANAKRLDRAVSNIVKQGIANSKTARQIQAELEKTMNMNRGKAKSIARTETNYYKSATKMEVGRKQEKIGNIVVKTWIHTRLSFEPRESHVRANGQKVEGIDSYFTVGGFKTKAPQQFGIASQDINCTCDMKMEFQKDVDMSKYNG